MRAISWQPCAAALSAVASVASLSEGASAQDPSAQPSALPAGQAADGQVVQNALFVEGFGGGIFYSLNYERKIVDPLGVRVGLGLLPVSASHPASGLTAANSSTEWIVFVPVTVSYVGIRAGPHALELGGGLTGIYASGYSNVSNGSSGAGADWLGLVMAGYRYEPVHQRGFTFRVGAQLSVARRELLQGSTAGDDLIAQPWPYISLGAAF